jgi:hypothetical protein
MDEWMTPEAMHKNTALSPQLRMDWPPPTWVCASHRLVSSDSRSAAGIMGGVYSPGIPLALLKREQKNLHYRLEYIYWVYLELMYIYILWGEVWPQTPSRSPCSPPPSPTRSPTPKNSFNKKNSFHLFAILCSHLVHLPIRYFPETIFRCIYLSI